MAGNDVDVHVSVDGRGRWGAKGAEIRNRSFALRASRVSTSETPLYVPKIPCYHVDLHHGRRRFDDPGGEEVNVVHCGESRVDSQPSWLLLCPRYVRHSIDDPISRPYKCFTLSTASIPHAHYIPRLGQAFASQSIHSPAPCITLRKVQ